MPPEFKTLSPSIYECKYHIIFCPKYRYRVLGDEMADDVKRKSIRCATTRMGGRWWKRMGQLTTCL
jgi:REP element-mobilizing transposase RayT